MVEAADQSGDRSVALRFARAQRPRSSPSRSQSQPAGGARPVHRAVDPRRPVGVRVRSTSSSGHCSLRSLIASLQSPQDACGSSEPLPAWPVRRTPLGVVCRGARHAHSACKHTPTSSGDWCSTRTDQGRRAVRPPASGRSMSRQRTECSLASLQGSADRGGKPGHLDDGFGSRGSVPGERT
jgi:hypothetical protein